MRAIALILLAFAGPAAADCAAWGLAPKVLTAANAVIPADGGIVVAATPQQQGKLDKGDPAIQRGWKIHVGNDTMKPPIDTIAPGLAVYRVAMPNAFKVELEDDQHNIVATVKPAHGSADKLAAPKVKRVTFESRAGYHGYEQVNVELDGDAPAGMLAMVLADDKGTPRSWTPAGGATLHPWASRDCVALPNGTVPSKAGDKITLMWVDESGRVSAATKPIAIAAP